MPRTLLKLTIAAATFLVGSHVYAQSGWREGFEGPENSWKTHAADARYSIVRHQRVNNVFHRGSGSEMWTIRGQDGSYVRIEHDAGRARIIEDLKPSVWVKSDRSGVQLSARVVLPRTEDPRTGKPVATILHGTSYGAVGGWTRLEIENLPQLLARQVRVLRTELGPDVDGREAYVESLLLNIYGGPGETSVWIDDLELGGFVAAPQAPTGMAPIAPDSVYAGAKPRYARLVGSLLTVEGKPVFPRIIEHRGEPLELLKRLGFNAVSIGVPPSDRFLAEANRLGMWVVCPPPKTAAVGSGPGAVARIGAQYNSVLAWDLGRGLTDEQLEFTRTLADQVRAADRDAARPLICSADTQMRAYSRHVDLLLIGRRPLGTSLELAAYGEWIRQRPRLARPGTPVWTTIQTQPSDALQRQLAVLDGTLSPPNTVSSEQLRLMAYTAVAAGSRGLMFQSQSPLNATDDDTKRRAMALELLNLELQLIEPWAAAGTFQASAEGSQPGIGGAILRTDRARLLLPTWASAGAQCVPDQAGANHVSLLLPGIPESATAYELVPGRLRPLRSKRVTGGMRVTLDEFGLGTLVLLSQDPLIVNGLSQRTAKLGTRAAELSRHIAAAKLASVTSIVSKMPPRTAASGAEEFLAAARKNLQWCDGYLAARDYSSATTYAQRAMRAMRLLERACWEEAVAGLKSPVASPGTVSFSALPWHKRLVERIRASQFGPDVLPGGDAEDLNAMLRAGWRHFEHRLDGVRTAADLTPVASHSGNTGLRLLSRPADPTAQPGLIETPPVWITTSPVPVEAMGLVCISGWVKIPEPIAGSVDGLMIIDSLTGEPMAERIVKTEGWQQFTLYRLAPQSGHLTVTFALSGLGEVWLDDITIRPLYPAGNTAVTGSAGQIR